MRFSKAREPMFSLDLGLYWMGNPEDEDLLRDLWEAGEEREFVLETLEAGCEFRAGRPAEY